MKAPLRFGLRIVLLTVLLFLIFAIATAVSGLSSTNTSEHKGAALALVFVCFAFSVVTSYPVIRSRWSGWPLILTMFSAIFGIMTFLSQIETVVFLKYLVDIVAVEMIPKLFLQGAVIAALFAPVLVLVHGKFRKPQNAPVKEERPRLAMPAKEWLWRLLVIAICYMLIYFSFGLFVFIPLAGEAFSEYYADLQMPQWMLLFQAARALVWAAVAVPIIRMMQGERWEAGLAVALLYSVLMGFLLLIPTEIMPDRIRLAHFVEVTSSNFVFGWLVVWVLTAPRPFSRRPVRP
ncbi:MAG: hypothetical protein H0Z38_03930 [Firmicutes bacterium]|nr:hypothetical protein [Bacillota bacterium]